MLALLLECGDGAALPLELGTLPPSMMQPLASWLMLSAPALLAYHAGVRPASSKVLNQSVHRPAQHQQDSMQDVSISWADTQCAPDKNSQLQPCPTCCLDNQIHNLCIWLVLLACLLACIACMHARKDTT